MTGYFRVASWLAYLGGAILVLWGVNILARLFMDLRLPGGEFGAMILMIASFLFYELAVCNLALLLGRLDHPALRRVFFGLAIAPAVLIASFIAWGAWNPGAPEAAYTIMLALYLAYAVALGGSGLHLFRRVTDGVVARVGAPLAVAGGAYALHAAVGLLALATESTILPQIGFWLMLAGGAAIALAQFRLGSALRHAPNGTGGPAR